MYDPRAPRLFVCGLFVCVDRPGYVLATRGRDECVVGVVKARSHRSVCGPSGWRTTSNLFLKAIGFTVETQRDITQWRSLRVAKYTKRPLVREACSPHARYARMRLWRD